MEPTQIPLGVLCVPGLDAIGEDVCYAEARGAGVWPQRGETAREAIHAAVDNFQKLFTTLPFELRRFPEALGSPEGEFLLTWHLRRHAGGWTADLPALGIRVESARRGGLEASLVQEVERLRSLLIAGTARLQPLAYRGAVGWLSPRGDHLSPEKPARTATRAALRRIARLEQLPVCRAERDFQHQQQALAWRLLRQGCGWPA